VTHRLGAISQRPGSCVSGTAASLATLAGRAAIASGRGIRIALHPADLSDDRLVRSARQLLDAGRRRPSITYAELVGASLTGIRRC
jgi:sirohydrochlorin ferrochelatase